MAIFGETQQILYFGLNCVTHRENRWHTQNRYLIIPMRANSNNEDTLINKSYHWYVHFVIYSLTITSDKRKFLASPKCEKCDQRYRATLFR